MTVTVKKYNEDYSLGGREYKDYLYRRLFKLMSGYWIIYILGFIISFIVISRPLKVYFTKDIFTGIYNMLVDISGLAYLFNTPTLNGTWWYMTLAIFIILMIPFIARLTKKFGPLLTIMLCIFIPRLISQSNITRWFMAIALGVICAQYDLFAKAKSFMITKNRFLSKLIKFVLLTAVLIGLFCARVKLGKSGESSFSYELNDNFTPIFYCYYCYEFIVGIPIVRHILIFIGKHSMNVFLLHTFIRQYMLRDFVYSFEHFALITLVVLVMSLVISIVLEIIRKYLGYNQLIKFIDKKISGRTAA